MTASEKISIAKAYLMLKHPFYASVVLRLQIKEEVDDCPTIFTDGKILGYNKEFINTLSKNEVVAALAHEAEHILFLHFARLGNRDATLFNMAGDYVINEHLTNSGFTLPKECLLDSQYYGLSTEQVYDRLQKNTQQLSIPFLNIGEVRQPKNDDGSKMTSAQIKQLEAEVRIGIEQAAQLAKKQGKLPAYLERLVAITLEPVVNWKEALQEFAVKSAKNDYTWTKRNKRYTDVYLPSLETPEIGDIVIAIDTSGSLDNKQLGEIASEIQAIMATFAMTVTVIYCDAKVQRVETYHTSDEFGLKMYGGGGTNYIPVFEEIKTLDISPACLLYFTDGFCWSFPHQAPDYKVMWVLTERYDDFKPPFGNTIHMR